MEDEQIVALYFARDEQAVARTDEKYGAYCFSLANRILCSEADAEETVSDTYLNAWRSIPPTRPKVLRLFLAKITRNLAFSRWRSETAQKRGGGEVPLVLDELAECVSDASAVDARLADYFREESYTATFYPYPEQSVPRPPVPVFRFVCTHDVIPVERLMVCVRVGREE